MGADGDRGLLVTGEEGPDVPDGIAFGRHADFLEELGQEGLRLAPGLGPADALRAGRATGSAVELTQVGYHAAGVDGRPGTHADTTTNGTCLSRRQRGHACWVCCRSGFGTALTQPARVAGPGPDSAPRRPRA